MFITLFKRYLQVKHCHNGLVFSINGFNKIRSIGFITSISKFLTSSALITLIAFGATTINVANADEPKDCTLPSNWFDNPNGNDIPDPAILAWEINSQTKCQFHQWSWNAFLWAMQDMGDNLLRFETFPTMEETVNANWDPDAKREEIKLNLRVGKADHPIDSVAQAGTTGILVAQNNYPVYYSQHINPQMFEDITERGWTTANGIASAPQNSLFEIGDVEYKAAWAVVSSEDDIPGAYTRMASIPELTATTIAGTYTIGVPKNPIYNTELVALIGLHVVGWVNGHSEAVWASFSPKEIASIVGQTDADRDPSHVVTDTAGPFIAAGTTVADCNQTQNPVQRLNDDGQTLKLTTQVCQMFENGDRLPQDQTNNNSVNQVNASAAELVPSGLQASGYSEVGAVWSNKDDRNEWPLIQKEKLNVTFQNQLTGSTVLSNPVIETFTQTQVGADNCLTCHNSLQFQPSNPSIDPLKPSMLNLSHFLMQIYVDTAKGED